MKTASSTSRRTAAAWIAVASLALWSGLVFLFAVPLALTSSVPWRQVIVFAASFWGLWLFFLPFVAWFSFRLPVQRSKLVRNICFHLLACLLIVAANRAAFPLFGRLLRPSPLAPRLGPPAAFGVLIGLRSALDILVYGSVLGICQAIAQFRRSQDRERRAAELEASLTSARLHALRMQLNPHFLFNTLNSIAALIHLNPRAADEMLGDLSGLLRRSLDSIEEQEIPLAREIEFLGAYLRIEQTRFGDRLRLDLSIPQHLQDALVPSLLLQPLVENAIRHGIEPRPGPGLITVEAKQHGAQLHLIVRDDGVGFPGKDLHNSANPRIGLCNTSARLRALYGADQSFTVQRAEPQGCQVHIILPLHVQSPQNPVLSLETGSQFSPPAPQPVRFSFKPTA